MPKDTNNLPYFKVSKKAGEKTLANFLLRKFKPKIKKEFPQHSLAQPIHFKTLEFIREASKKYPHFLRFDVRLYYPSINHQILLKNLPEIYQKISGDPISRRFKKYLENELPEFLSESPYSKGLPIGSFLSYALAGIFLLGLDYKLKNPFLRQVKEDKSSSLPFTFVRKTDDYLVFCKNKKEPELLLKNIILPKLNELGLEMNEKKLKSGKFHQDKVSFIGFEFYPVRYSFNLFLIYLLPQAVFRYFSLFVASC